MRKRENIKKICLIGICIIIIIIIFFRNIIGGVGREPGENTEPSTKEQQGISREEAFRLFSFLLYDKAEREGLEWKLENETKEEYPSLEYVNALATAGIYEWKETENPEDLSNLLTCGEFRDLLVNLSGNKSLNYNEIVEKLPERLKKVRRADNLYREEFLSVFEVLAGMINEQAEEELIRDEQFYFIGMQTNGSGEINGRLIDEEGRKYYYRDARDYSTEETGAFQAESYIDTPIQALLRGTEIIYVSAILDKPVTLSNVYMIKGQESTIRLFVGGMEREYETVFPLSETFERKVGDVTVDDGIITAVTVKPDTIGGKVLLTTDHEIEIEGYGTLPVDEKFKIYKIYGTLAIEQTSSILVGYSITDFVVSDGVVCAALIKESIKAENIRVLINTSGYKSLYHSTVKLTADTPFLIIHGESQDIYEAGEEIVITPEDDLMKDGRIKIVTVGEEGKINLLSVDRSYGTPSYRGSMEIAVTEEGLTIVNELSLEEYLYSVVPSEMPVSYGAEALKVQAVCARSYAYNQLLANKYSAFGAHVDDSVNSQVYNNIKESEDTILAVKDTYGQILTYHEKVLSAYYFSTSSGHTASVEEVWENGEPVPYFTGSLQTEDKSEVDLSGEADFRDFIDEGMVKKKLADGVMTSSVETYDSGFLMYRWHVTISSEDLSSHINKTISGIYKQAKNSVLTLESQKNPEGLTDGTGIRILDGAVYKSKPITEVGQVTDMKVISRGTSGIIQELLITGTKNTVLIRFQNNIRKLLAPVEDDLYRLDDSVMSGMNMLPSAFFYIKTEKKNGKVSAYTLVGGGYGHGVGMSQNGVKAMTKQGKSYREILEHYYTDVEFGFMYE